MKLSPSSVTPKAIERLRKEIKEQFGVDLDIKHTATTSMARDLAEGIMEYQAGATPTYDIMSFSDAVVQANAAGILEQVDWKPLITKDTNPAVVLQHPAYRGAIVHYTGYIGLLYNPEKVPAAQVPKVMSDLANPKWMGKVAILNTPTIWARWAFILGKEKTFADLRAIVKNKAVPGLYADESNRYLLGEVWMCYLTSAYLQTVSEKGMPAVWQCLDFAEVREYCLVVRKGAAHPNAAKLLAIYIASPQGAKFILEEGGAGNLNYPGNYEHDIKLQNEKQGIPEVTITYPGLLEFLDSTENVQWQKDIDLIIKTGG